jgi:hypothetical protein
MTTYRGMEIVPRVLASVTFLACIREMTGSNLSWETDYRDSGFSWISPVPRSKFRDISNYATTVYFQVLSS